MAPVSGDLARGDALRAGSILTSAGEFAFVLIPLAATLGTLDAGQAGLLTAIAAISMLLGPAVASATEGFMRRFMRAAEPEADDFAELRGSVLVIGFGRFGQIVSQCLLAEGVDVTAIDSNPEMIRQAGRFEFKVYYGDGTRLDVLRAAGAANVRPALRVRGRSGCGNTHCRSREGGVCRTHPLRALV